MTMDTRQFVHENETGARPLHPSATERQAEPAHAQPDAIAQRRLTSLIDESPRVARARNHEALAAHSPQSRQMHEIQRMANGANRSDRTGLPGPLKAGIESLSGLSMDHVTVHYDSSRPSRLHAHAYAQGSDIHLGAGQERHLPHEAWHVVQQAQGRVRATTQLKSGVQINNDASLEQEADRMGARAASATIGATDRAGAASGPGSAGGLVAQRRSFFIGETRYKSESLSHAEILERIEEIEKLSDPAKAKAKDSLNDALKDDIEKATKKKETEYAAERLKLQQRLNNGGEQVASPMPSAQPHVPSFALSKNEVSISGANEPTLFGNGMGLTGFEKSSEQDKGDEHFQKHGHEVGADSKQKYIKSAQDLGRSKDSRFIEAKVKNTLIRFDPDTKQIVISSGKLIRTHYVWDEKYSDPVAYAIYYTITSNIGIGLSAVANEVFDGLLRKHIDLKAMEVEYVRIGFDDQKSVGQLASETKLAEAAVLNILKLPPVGSTGKDSGLPEQSASSGSVAKETFNIMGTRYDVTDPRIRHDGNCLWDTLEHVYGYSSDTLRLAADNVEGVAYGTYVDDVLVGELLTALGAPGMTLHVWQYGKEDEAKRTVIGDGSIVIGLAYDPTGQGHYIPPVGS